VNEDLFAAALALAWFGAVNLALSAISAAGGHLIDRRFVRLRASAAPAVLLGLKLLPGVGSLAFTAFVFLPGHWIFEPEGAQESLGVTLGALAALGAFTIALAGRRAVRDARLTRDVERSWETRASGPRRDLGGELPVYCLPDEAPIISLVGLRHPRVFVARPVIEAFASDELEVSLAHELAHRDARDNLKRVVVASSPDLLALWRAGRRLEQRWRAAAEFAADARAVQGSATRAVSLASALLKVARLVPAGGSLRARTALYDGSLLSARIDRLLAPAESPLPRRNGGLAWSLPLFGITVLAAVLAADAVWLGVHAATEGLVRFLP
jgi:hypothetical protein